MSKTSIAIETTSAEITIENTEGDEILTWLSGPTAQVTRLPNGMWVISSSLASTITSTQSYNFKRCVQSVIELEKHFIKFKNESESLDFENEFLF